MDSDPVQVLVQRFTNFKKLLLSSAPEELSDLVKSFEANVPNISLQLKTMGEMANKVCSYGTISVHFINACHVLTENATTGITTSILKDCHSILNDLMIAITKTMKESLKKLPPRQQTILIQELKILLKKELTIESFPDEALITWSKGIGTWYTKDPESYAKFFRYLMYFMEVWRPDVVKFSLSVPKQ